MSDGLKDALSMFMTDRDALDGKDPWDDEEITQIVKDLYEPLSWLVPVCECGSEKTYGPQSPHSFWCPKV